MPAIVTDDGVKLHAEETGQGEPLLFVHEFAGDHSQFVVLLEQMSNMCCARPCGSHRPACVPQGG